VILNYCDIKLCMKVQGLSDFITVRIFRQSKDFQNDGIYQTTIEALPGEENAYAS